MKKQHYLYESCLEERTNTSNLNHVKIMDPPYPPSPPNLRLCDLSKSFRIFSRLKPYVIVHCIYPESPADVLQTHLYRAEWLFAQ